MRHAFRLIAFLAFLTTPAVAQHDPGSVKDIEHQHMMALFEPSSASHIASGGSCSDPATWGGTLPDATSRVLVPAGVVVTCDVLRTRHLRVDGEMRVPSGARITLDTWLVTGGGRLEIGTAAAPAADVIVTFVGGPIIGDPMLLGRGLVSHGALTIHGIPRTSWSRVTAGPMAGASVIAVDDATGWGVGDTIVIAGTRYDGHQFDGFHQPEDEVRTIAAIDGGTITLDAPLVHDHDAPRADLRTAVGNLTRSVTFQSVETTPDRRGHLMVMHAPAAEIRYAAFRNMGRTDKSVDALPADPANTDPTMNVQGRYAVHLHRTGVDAAPAVVVGNAVWGSPGWGIVDHDSHAVLDANVTFDTFGAGFVAESGNERGTWSNNLAIYAKGRAWISAKDANFDGHETYDLGRTGDGFVLHGRQLTISGNVAASVNHGFVFYHRGKFGDGMAMHFDAADTDFPAAFWYGAAMPPDRHPILGFDGNEVFAARVGLVIDKASQFQRHDVHTVLTGFLAWNVRNGALFGYTGHYTIDGFDVVGIGEGDGIALGTNVIDMTLISPAVEGFARGINAHKNFTQPPPDPTRPGLAIIGATLANNGTDMVNLLPEEVLASATAGPLSVTLDPMAWTGTGCLCIQLTGAISDSLGVRPVPTQGDLIQINLADMLRILAVAGWWDTDDGRRVALVPFWVSDRLTGDHVAVPAEIEIAPGVNLAHPAYAGAVYNGVLPPDDPEPDVAGLQAAIAALQAENAALNASVTALRAALQTIRAGADAALQ